MRSSNLRLGAVVENTSPSSCLVTPFLLVHGEGNKHTLEFAERAILVPDFHKELEQRHLALNETERPLHTGEPALPNRSREGAPSGDYDLCYLHQRATGYCVDCLLTLVSHRLRPGGWLLVNGVKVDPGRLRLPYQQVNQAENGKPFPALNEMFTSIVEYQPEFGNFRTIEGWGFAQKLAPQEEDPGLRGTRDRLIAHAIECAHHDPDFREFLLMTPREALEFLTGHPLDWLEVPRFREALTDVYPGVDVQGQTYLLRTPAWLPLRSRRIMEKLLNLRGGQ